MQNICLHTTNNIKLLRFARITSEMSTAVPNQRHLMLLSITQTTLPSPPTVYFIYSFWLNECQFVHIVSDESSDQEMCLLPFKCCLESQRSTDPTWLTLPRPLLRVIEIYGQEDISGLNTCLCGHVKAQVSWCRNTELISAISDAKRFTVPSNGLTACLILQLLILKIFM